MIKIYTKINPGWAKPGQPELVEEYSCKTSGRALLAAHKAYLKCNKANRAAYGPNWQSWIEIDGVKLDLAHEAVIYQICTGPRGLLPRFAHCGAFIEELRREYKLQEVHHEK